MEQMIYVTKEGNVIEVEKKTSVQTEKRMAEYLAAMKEQKGGENNG